MDASKQEIQSRGPVEGQHDDGTLGPGAHLTAVVSGDVQGVGFRAFVRQHARALRLSGWVRNLPDGDVALEADGPRETLEALARHLHQGPPGSAVARVQLTWSAEQGWHDRFEVVR